MAFLKSIVITVAQMLVNFMVKYIQREKAKVDAELAKKELDNAQTNEEIEEAVKNDDSYSNA